MIHRSKLGMMFCQKAPEISGTDRNSQRNTWHSFMRMRHMSYEID